MEMESNVTVVLRQTYEKIWKSYETLRKVSKINYRKLYVMWKKQKRHRRHVNKNNVEYISHVRRPPDIR